MAKNSPSDMPLVAVIMGSQSDWEVMHHSLNTLKELGIPCEAKVISAHRTPARLESYVSTARERGLKVFIAGAGMAAALPGAIAALTPLPVFGVPLYNKAFGGMDSLLAMVQMPGGIPVGALAVGKAGAINAALLAASVLGLSDGVIAAALEDFRAKQTANVSENPED